MMPWISAEGSGMEFNVVNGSRLPFWSESDVPTLMLLNKTVTMPLAAVLVV